MDWFLPVSVTAAAVPGLADAPDGSMVLVVSAPSLVWTTGVTSAEADCSVALSAVEVAVLVIVVPLMLAGASGDSLTGIVIVSVSPDFKPVLPPPRA